VNYLILASLYTAWQGVETHALAQPCCRHSPPAYAALTQTFTTTSPAHVFDNPTLLDPDISSTPHSYNGHLLIAARVHADH
jgi:hypothetical protein